MAAERTELHLSSWGQPRRHSEGLSVESICMQVVDFGIAAIVFATPLLLGGRHPLGRLILVALCGIIAFSWCVRQSVSQQGYWTRTKVNWLLLAVVALVTFQLVPLPGSWIETLAPKVAQLLPLWSDSDSETISLGTWSTISVAPSQTRIALSTLIAYVLLFVTVSQRIETVEDIKRLCNWIGLSAVFAALFGLLQYFTSNGLYFWFYEYPYSHTAGDIKGSFTNRNHFAHFVVLGLAPLVALLLDGRTKKESSGLRRRSTSRGNSELSHHASTILFGVLTVVLIGTILITRSRGGALAAACCLALLGTIYWRMKLVKAGDLGLIVAGLVVALVSVVSIYGYDRVASRLEDYTTGSIDSLDQGRARRTIWEANINAIESGGIVGSGAGTHQFIYPAFLKQPSPVEYTHAESSPLQIVTENGVPGLLLLLMCLGTGVAWCAGILLRASSKTERLYAGAISAALATSLVHAMIDFVWFVPACMAVTIVLASLALRLSQLCRRSEERYLPGPRLSRPAWVGLSVLVFFVGTFSVLSIVNHAKASVSWDRYRLAAISQEPLRDQLSVIEIEEQRLNELQTINANINSYMIDQLGKVVALDETNGRAHLKLAACLLSRFDQEGLNAANQMTVPQIRDAVVHSKFGSSKQLAAWLQRALGERAKLLYQALYHAKQAVQYSPMQGEAYCYLANLCFLEGRDSSWTNALFRQAQLVGPQDGDVLFETGTHLAASGRLEEAFNAWRVLFQTPIPQQRQVVVAMAGALPAEVFLRAFRPQPHILPYLWYRYQHLDSREDAIALERYLVAMLINREDPVETDERSDMFRLLATVQLSLEKEREALQSYRAASQAEPQDFHTHYQIAALSFKFSDFELAEKELRWCLARHPENVAVNQLLKKVSKIKLANRTRSPLKSTGL